MVPNSGENQASHDANLDHLPAEADARQGSDAVG
jgi:hypothetical protein